MWTLAAERASADGNKGNSSPGLGSRASTPHVTRAYEAYVLQSMSVDDAARTIAEGLDTEVNVDLEDEKFASPLVLLARHAIRYAVRQHAETAFLRETGDTNVNIEAYPETVTGAALSLDARTAALAGAAERICAFGSEFSLLEQEASEAAPADKELYALLQAVSLCRSLRLFPSTAPHAGKAPLAPPPAASFTPSSEDVDARRQRSLRLRRALASGAFECNDAIEEARDRAVDVLLADREHEGKTRAGIRVSVRAS